METVKELLQVGWYVILIIVGVLMFFWNRKRVKNGEPLLSQEDDFANSAQMMEMYAREMEKKKAAEAAAKATEAGQAEEEK